MPAAGTEHGGQPSGGDGSAKDLRPQVGRRQTRQRVGRSRRQGVDSCQYERRWENDFPTSCEMKTPSRFRPHPPFGVTSYPHDLEIGNEGRGGRDTTIARLRQQRISSRNWIVTITRL